MYFRFEDRVQIRNDMETFSIGIKLKLFAIFTGDSNYNKISQVSKEVPKPVADDTHLLTYKVAKIEGLSVFCDWQDYFDPRTDFFDLDKLIKTQDKEMALTYFKDVLAYEFSDKS